MTDEIDAAKQSHYKGVINYEAILGGQITRVALYRDTNLKRYASAVETYALMCPPDIAEKAIKHLSELGLTRCEYEGMNKQKEVLYDDLFLFINDTLKNDANLIFKTSVFETGHD